MRSMLPNVEVPWKLPVVIVVLPLCEASTPYAYTFMELQHWSSPAFLAHTKLPLVSNFAMNALLPPYSFSVTLPKVAVEA